MVKAQESVNSTTGPEPLLVMSGKVPGIENPNPDPDPVPIPGTLALIGLGLATLRRSPQRLSATIEP